MGTRRFNLLMVALMLTVAFSGTGLFAANGTWDGAGNDNWTTGGTNGDDDWTGASYPGFGAGETATFDATSTDTATVSAALANPASVTMNGANATIDIGNGITLAIDTLTLTTAHTITFNNTGGGGATVTVEAMPTPGAAANITIGANVTVEFIGTTDFTGLGTITNGGVIRFDTATTATAGGAFTVTGCNELAGAVEVETDDGNALTLNAAAGVSIASLDIEAVSGTVATNAQGWTITGNLSVDSTSTGAITFGAALTVNGTTTMDGTSVTTVTTSLTAPGADAAGLFDLNNGGLVVTTTSSIDGNMDVESAFDNLTLGDGVTFSGADMDIEMTANVNIGNITFDDTTTIDLDDADGFTGTFALGDGDSVTVTGSMTLADNMTIGGGASGTFTITGTITTTANITSGAGSTTTFQPTTGSTLNLTSAGSHTFSGAVVFATNGTLTLTLDAVDDFAGAVTVNDQCDVTSTTGLTLGGLLTIGSGAGAAVLEVDGAFDSNGQSITVGALDTLDLDGATTVIDTGGTVTVSATATAFTIASPTVTLDAAANVTFANAGTITFDGGVAQAVSVSNAETDDMGDVTITGAGTDVTFSTNGVELTDLNVAAGAIVEFGVAADINGNLDINDTCMADFNAAVSVFGNISNDGTLDTGTATWTFDGNADQTITDENDGTIAFGGNLAVANNGGTSTTDDVTVALGTTVTIAGTTSVTDGSFGAAEDGATSTDMATITYTGNVTVNVTDGWLPGEGTHNFGGSIDFGTQDDVTTAPGVANNSAAVINLTDGGAITLDFTANGSGFWADSIAAGTAVTQDGKMLLWGDLIFTTTASWAVDGAGAADAIDVEAADATDMDSVGSTTLTDGDNGLDDDSTIADYIDTITVICVGTGNCTFPAISVLEHFDFDAGAAGTTDDESGAVQLAIVHSTTTGPGTITITSITVESDTSSDDAGDTVDDRNINLVILATDMTISGDVTVAAATDTDDDSASNVWVVVDSTLTGATAPDITVDSVTLTAAAAGFDGGNLLIDTANITIDDTETVTIGLGASLTVDDSTITAATGDDYTILVSADAKAVSITESTITAADANSLTITLGGDSLSLLQNTFSNYTAAGVQIAINTVISLLQENTFTDGQDTGSHLQFLGAIGNARINADGNTFDDSTSGGSVTAAAGEIVMVAADADEVAITFRAAAAVTTGFGDGWTLTATNAESDDNDGNEELAGGGDDDVVWEDDLESVTFALDADSPDTIYVNTEDSATVSKQTVFLFGLTAATGTISVTGVTIGIEYDGELNDLVDDIAGSTVDVILFNDADADGRYDSGEEIDDAEIDHADIADGDDELDFAGLAEDIAVGTPQNWGLAFLVDAAAAGTFSVEIDVDGVTVDDGIVLGLPVEVEDIDLQDANLAVVENADENGDALDNKNYTSGQTPMVLAFNVTNSVATTAGVNSIELTITASQDDDGDITAADLNALIERLVMFSSADDEFDADYDEDLAGDFNSATSGDDTFFDDVPNGAGIAFAASGDDFVATVTFTPAAAVNVVEGDTVSFFLVLDIDNDDNATVLSAARSNKVSMVFRLAETTTGAGTGTAADGIGTAGGAEDTVTVTDNDTTTANTQISSQSWKIVSPAEDKKSSCSLDAINGDSSGFAWVVLALGLLAVYTISRRRVS